MSNYLSKSTALIVRYLFVATESGVKSREAVWKPDRKKFRAVRHSKDSTVKGNSSRILWVRPPFTHNVLFTFIDSVRFHFVPFFVCYCPNKPNFISPRNKDIKNTFHWLSMATVSEVTNIYTFLMELSDYIYLTLWQNNVIIYYHQNVRI